MRELTGRTSRGATSETTPPPPPPSSTPESRWIDGQNRLTVDSESRTRSLERVGTWRCVHACCREQRFAEPPCVDVNEWVRLSVCGAELGHADHWRSER